jgi:glycerol-3-phosphate O-acyltransferase / dihydroxyacetone phosphate acyltransferase
MRLFAVTLIMFINRDTLFAARMARDLLWQEEGSIPLNDFVSISQTWVQLLTSPPVPESDHTSGTSLVDLFSTPDITPNFTSVRRHLLTYYSLLQSTNLTNSVLSSLPLPATLDPSKRTPLTLRLRTLFALIQETLACLIYLPFFLFPLLVHLPVYIMARLGASLVVDEEETLAQNKVVLGLLAMILVYPAAFMFLWAIFFFTPIGALVAAATMYWFAVYHNRLVNCRSLTVYVYSHSHISNYRYLSSGETCHGRLACSPRCLDSEAIRPPTR